MTGIVLVGGKSSRLGRDKALELVGTRSLLERAVAALATVSQELLIVGKAQNPGVAGSWPLPIRFVADDRPGHGPLSGLHTGLSAASYPLAYLVGCDMPFLQPSLLQFLAALAEGHDAVVPHIGEVPQTLHAVYGRSCLAAVESLLAQEGTGIRDLLPLVRVRTVDETELQRLDPELRSFFNINTPDELSRARLLALQGIGGAS